VCCSVLQCVAVCCSVLQCGNGIIDGAHLILLLQSRAIRLIEYSSLRMGYRALSMGYRALLMGYRALSMGYRALSMGYRALSMGYRAFSIQHCARAFCMEHVSCIHKALYVCCIEQKRCRVSFGECDNV